MSNLRTILTILLCSTMLLNCEGEKFGKLILLGTGNPNATPERMGPSVAIAFKEKIYIVDAGVGLVRRAVQAGIQMNQLTTVFFTHLHSDHTTGFTDLIFTPAVVGRESPLYVYGPPGIKKMTNQLMAAFEEDIRARFLGEPDVNKKAYDVISEEIWSEGPVFKDEYVTVKAFRVQHGVWKYAYGYRFEGVDGSVIVLSGDTSYCDNLIAHAYNADILVHEVYSAKRVEAKSEAWQKYYKNGHTSAYELGKIANIVKPKKLVFYHIIAWEGHPPQELIDEIREVYSGPVVYSNDLDVVEC